MPDFSLKVAGSFCVAAASMSQSLVIRTVLLLHRRDGLSMGGFLFFELNQRVMDDLKNEAPFMEAPVQITVAGGRAIGALPGEDIVERVAQQRLFRGDDAHEGGGVFEIFTLTGVAGVAKSGTAGRLHNPVAVLARGQKHMIVEFKSASHV